MLMIVALHVRNDHYCRSDDAAAAEIATCTRFLLLYSESSFSQNSQEATEDLIFLVNNVATGAEAIPLAVRWVRIGDDGSVRDDHAVRIHK